METERFLLVTNARRILNYWTLPTIIGSMEQVLRFSAIIRKEATLYSSWCPEIDVASQGKSVEEALANLREAIELYFEDEDAKPPTGELPIITFVDVKLDEKAASGIRA